MHYIWSDDQIPLLLILHHLHSSRQETLFAGADVTVWALAAHLKSVQLATSVMQSQAHVGPAVIAAQMPPL